MNITFVKKIECFWKRAYGWAKLRGRLGKKAIGIGVPTRLGLSVDMKKKLRNEINFYINFGAKINYIPYYTFHLLMWQNWAFSSLNWKILQITLTLLCLTKNIIKSDNISKANPILGWNFCEDQLGEKTSWVPFFLPYVQLSSWLLIFSKEMMAKLKPNTPNSRYFTNNFICIGI